MINIDKENSLVAVLNVVPASAPDPLILEVVGPLCTGTATARQLSVPAAP